MFSMPNIMTHNQTAFVAAMVKIVLTGTQIPAKPRNSV
jgi:hypothetical protein